MTANLLTLCFDLIEAISLVRLNPTEIELTSTCTINIVSLMRLLNKGTTSIGAYESELRKCLLKMIRIMQRIANQEENYFCTYKYEIYKIELKSIITYFCEIVNACLKTGDTYDPAIKVSHYFLCICT